MDRWTMPTPDMSTPPIPCNIINFQLIIMTCMIAGAVDAAAFPTKGAPLMAPFDALLKRNSKLYAHTAVYQLDLKSLKGYSQCSFGG